jgi:hypothetical protein
MKAITTGGGEIKMKHFCIPFVLAAACTAEEPIKDPPQEDESYDFTSQQEVRLFEEQECSNYMPLLTGWGINLQVSRLEAPEPPYEIRSLSVRLYSAVDAFLENDEEGEDYMRHCDTTVPLTLFLYVGDDGPMSDPAMADFAAYTSEPPFAFPELETGFSALVTGERGVTGSLGDSWTWQLSTEVATLVLEEPYLVEEEGALWIGTALYDDSDANISCLSMCLTDDSGTSNVFDGELWEERSYQSWNPFSAGVVVGY